MPTLIPIKALSALRFLVGASCLILPRQAGAFWGVPLAAGGEPLMYARLFGVRDLAIGAYLWKRVGDVEKASQSAGSGSGVRASLLNNNKPSPLENGVKTGFTTSSATIPAFARDSDVASLDRDHELAIANVRSALWLGLIVDLADIVSVGLCWVDGSPLSGLGEFWIGGGATLFVATQAHFLWASRRV